MKKNQPKTSSNRRYFATYKQIGINESSVDVRIITGRKLLKGRFCTCTVKI